MQESQKSQSNLKMNKVGGFTFPDFKTQQKATIIRAMWYWQEDKHVDQWNRAENPETNPYICGN